MSLKSTPYLVALVLSASSVIAMTPHATATPTVILDFEEFRETEADFVLLGTELNEDGFTLSANITDPGNVSGEFFTIGEPSALFFPGSAIIIPDAVEGETVLTYGGAAFDLDSVDLFSIFGDSPVDVTFTGLTADGNIVEFDTSVLNDGDTIFLGDDFNNVVRVSSPIPEGAGNLVGFDNFVVTPVIPEPASIALLAIGSLTFMNRRRA